MRVQDGIEANYVFQTERFRLDYLQDLKKEANQRAQAQAAIVSLLLPTILLLYDHLSKRGLIDSWNRFGLVASLIALLLALVLSLVVLVPIPTGRRTKFDPTVIPHSGLTEFVDGKWDVDIDSIRHEAVTIAVLLQRRDRLLRISAVFLGTSIIFSTATLVRFLL